jgi:hypothetical protein
VIWLLVRRFPILIIVLATGAFGYVFRDQITGNVGDLRAGDCFDMPAGATAGITVSDIQHRPCTTPHDGEVISVVDYPAPAGSAPLAAATRKQFAADLCTQAFTTYTGRSFRAATEFDLGWFYPTNDGWANGDRSFTCWTVRLDQAKLNGSLKLGVGSQ